ncbi:VOC family protein [Streptomyces sp. NPDC088725]|uniref:VOC family protein n=1 Tax=Streptomyces sp. NPDC088725 TaxID=3365873 RepID=UPI00382862F7
MTQAAIRRRPGTPCWVSLMVHGLAETEDFYSALFGWSFVPGPEQLGPYVRAKLDGADVAGIGELPAGRRLPIVWMTYLATDDADKTAETIRSCGGTVGVGPLDAQDAGRMAIASDPSGAVFGIWQAWAHTGTAIAGAHGTPVWNELVTPDTSTVARFYQAVFGYDLAAAADPGADFVALRLDDAPVASLRGAGNSLSGELGSHWMTSFEVDDTDAAARLVTELGGRVIRPPGDTEDGRTATVADPEGAVFTLVRSAAR